MDGSLDQHYFQRSMVLGAVHELPTCNSWNTLPGQLPPLPITPYGFDNSFHQQRFGRNWQCPPPAYQSPFGQSYNPVMPMPVFAQSCSVVQPQFTANNCMCQYQEQPAIDGCYQHRQLPAPVMSTPAFAHSSHLGFGASQQLPPRGQPSRRGLPLRRPPVRASSSMGDRESQSLDRDVDANISEDSRPQLAEEDASQKIPLRRPLVRPSSSMGDRESQSLDRNVDLKSIEDSRPQLAEEDASQKIPLRRPLVHPSSSLGDRESQALDRDVDANSSEETQPQLAEQDSSVLEAFGRFCHFGRENVQPPHQPKS